MKINRKVVGLNKKGLSAIEIVVVMIVIVVVLAVMLVTYSVWITKARKQSTLVVCRACVVAAQCLASEAYGEGWEFDNEENEDDQRQAIKEIKDLAGTEGNIVKASFKDDKLVYLSYVSPNGYEMEYIKGEYRAK